MDFLDILEGRYYKTHTGRYFERLPGTVTYPTSIEQIYNLVEGQDFDYDIVDPAAWRYKQIIGNLEDSTAADATIKSCEALEWKVKGYVVLDTGRLMLITQVIEDVGAAQREAARLMPIPVGTEYVLRLVEVENPWGLV